MLAGLAVGGVDVQQAGDGNAAAGLPVAGELQAVGDPAQVAAHLVQLLRDNRAPHSVTRRTVNSFIIYVSLLFSCSSLFQDDRQVENKR